MTIATYTDLQTAVETWLARSSDTDVTGNIADIIRLAEARIRRDLNIESQETDNTTVSISSEFTALSTLSSQLTKIRRIANVTSSPYYTLAYRTPTQLLFDYPSSATGTPKAYTIVSSQLQLRPIPDGTYTFEIDYYKWFDPLATTATNTLLTNYPDVYLFGSLAEACLLIGDMDGFALWNGRYKEAADGVQLQDQETAYSGARLTIRGDSGNP